MLEKIFDRMRNPAYSYRDDDGNIVKSFGDQEHINMVNSSCIDNIEYNRETGDTFVKFRNNNKEYLFPDVPEDVVDGIKSAPSKGKYYHANIKQYSTNR